MDGLLVLKEETVATSLAGLVCDPSTFIVEEYSEEVGDFKDAEGMNIAQEVFIDNEPNTITYEVREVDGSEGLFPGGSGGGQELVLHSLHRVPEEERVSKAPVKKRRGRPPKFQISEIGEDGRKWYSCSVCEQKYEDRMELMQHMRQHNAVRPFHCKDCGKAFKQAAHLKVHVRQHTGEKPFECGVCGKGFRQKAIVDQHMRTHTQLRPYGCTYAGCDKSFAQKTSLDNHTKSHQTGRLSEAFKRQQEEQKKKSLLAQEVLKNKSKMAQLVQVLPGDKKKPVHRVLGSALPVGKEKIKTTVVKMTQSQFENYIHNRAGAEREGQGVSHQAALTSRQRAATGPFLAYVNLCKPLLQAKRPDLSLLEVLKELASQWNGMSRQEKQKFAVIAKESEDKQELSAVSFPTPEDGSTTAEEEVEANGSAQDDSGEGGSMEGAVFEVGEGATGSGTDYYRVLQDIDQEEGGLANSETLYEEKEQDCEKSLNQNVFGKKVLVLPKPSEGLAYDEETFGVSGHVFQNEGGTMEVVQGEIGEEVQFEEVGVAEGGMEDSVLEFEGGNTEGTVVFGGGEMEMEAGTIFFLPSMVGEEQLEEAMGQP